MSADSSTTTSPAEPSQNSETAPHTVSSWQSGSLVGLASALVVSGIIWLFLETLHPVFYTTEGMDQWGFLPLDVQWKLDRNNAMLVLGMMGGLAAGGLATGEALYRREWKAQMPRVFASGAVALLLAALAGYVGFRLFELVRYNHEIAELNRSLLVVGGTFSLTGLSVGLVVGLIYGRTKRVVGNAAIGGLVAGVAAGLAYPLIMAAFFPAALTSVLIPVETLDRFLWAALLTGLLGILIPWEARNRANGRAKSSR